MTATAVAEKPAPTAAPAEPRKPIPVDAIQLHAGGQCWSSHFCTLPEGWTLNDLGSPDIWRTIQGGAGALRVLDEVCIVDRELSWLAECRVVAATESGASIQILKKIDMPARNQALPEAGDWRIVFAGRGYGISHKKSGRPYGSTTYMTLGEAIRALHSIAPKYV